MKKPDISGKVFILILCLCSCCCSLYGKEKTPYVSNGDFLLAADTSKYQIAGLNLYFFNKSEKPVVSFTAVFYLFDEDGEPINTGKSNIAVSVQSEVEPMSAFEEEISLDKYFVTVPEEAYTVDFFYISKIIYADGTTWKDPFGMMAY